MLKTENALTSFQAFESQAWIDEYRDDREGPLDLDVTARNVGTTVIREMPIESDGKPMFADGCVEGLDNGGPVTVHLNPKRKNEHAYIFGHELGHIFLETHMGIIAPYRRQEVETFCNEFGRQIALPPKDIKEDNPLDGDSIQGLATSYNVSPEVVLLQCMRNGLLPNRIVIDAKMTDRLAPWFLGTVGRMVLCMDCEIGQSHEVDRAVDSPVYDYTDQTWLIDMHFGHCMPNYSFLKNDQHKALSELYGIDLMSDS